MKLYTKRYFGVLSNKTLKNEKNITILTDLHYNAKTSKELLLALVTEVAKENPDIICFAGDLVDDAKNTIESGSFSSLIVWLESLAKIAPVCLVKGNHDYFAYNNQTKTKEYYESKILFDRIANIPNIYILEKENAPFIDEEIAISGFDLGENTIEYFESAKESQSAFEKFVEPTLVQMERKLDLDRFNILLYHSPEHLYQREENKYNLLISGHMHNGALPNFLDTLLPGNRGLIAPISGPFPKYSRGMYELSEKTTGIIAPPITTIASINDWPLMRTLYKPGIAHINIKSEN